MRIFCFNIEWMKVHRIHNKQFLKNITGVIRTWTSVCFVKVRLIQHVYITGSPGRQQGTFEYESI